MSEDTYRTLLKQIQQLSTDEQLHLLEDLVPMLRKKSRPQHSITELKGLGKEIWEGVDIDEYIRQERDSWEPKNDEMKIHSSSQDLSQQTSYYSQEAEKVEIQIKTTIAGELKKWSRIAGTENRYQQSLDSLAEYVRQVLNSLRHPENPDLRSRDRGEKITQERDSWGG